MYSLPGSLVPHRPGVSGTKNQICLSLCAWRFGPSIPARASSCAERTPAVSGRKLLVVLSCAGLLTSPEPLSLHCARPSPFSSVDATLGGVLGMLRKLQLHLLYQCFKMPCTPDSQQGELGLVIFSRTPFHWCLPTFPFCYHPATPVKERVNILLLSCTPSA